MTTMTADAAGTTAEASLPITGMTCASCVRRVEKALAGVPGVREAAVNLPTEKARVVYDPAVANFEQLTAGVEKAGYGVGARCRPPPIRRRSPRPPPRPARSCSRSRG